MSEIVEIIDTLEGRLKKLVEKIDFLEQTAAQLTVDLQKATQTIHTQSEEMDSLKKQYDTLKIANSFFLIQMVLQSFLLNYYQCIYIHSPSILSIL